MLDTLAEMFSDQSRMMLALLVFLATAVLTFAIMLGVRSRGAIKRRAAGIAEHSGDLRDASRLRGATLKTMQRLLDYASKHYAVDKDKGETKVLRRRMIQAGILDERAVAYFLSFAPCSRSAWGPLYSSSSR